MPCAMLLGNGEAHGCGLPEELDIGHGQLDPVRVSHVEHGGCAT